LKYFAIYYAIFKKNIFLNYLAPKHQYIFSIIEMKNSTKAMLLIVGLALVGQTFADCITRKLAKGSCAAFYQYTNCGGNGLSASSGTVSKKLSQSWDNE